ncbi:hypothetical protein NSPZN2_100428 [Nitrospira defluvii]|uniref:Uncharacterized protein n=1 Tax=Nitrospira defluvii TaxID=330214 RepID=A0ABM8R4K0_9BACT|nr:hypothetical protein NSPZN2_100428 [Nitrospira defluvii]
MVMLSPTVYLRPGSPFYGFIERVQHLEGGKLIVSPVSVPSDVILHNLLEGVKDHLVAGPG